MTAKAAGKAPLHHAGGRRGRRRARAPAIAATLLLLSALSVTACAKKREYVYQEAAGDRVQIGEDYSVAPQITWTKFSNEKREDWTVHGWRLEVVSLFKGLEGGQSLFEAAEGQPARPQYEPAMKREEVVALIVASTKARGGEKVETANLRPAKFGSFEGFRFEISYHDIDGLMKRGTALGATKNNKLYLILYTGARSYYFDKYEDKVERIMQSVETAGT